MTMNENENALVNYDSL